MDSHTLLTHLSVEGHLDCFPFLATMNNVDMNAVTRFLCRHMFSFLLAKHLGSGVAAYHGAIFAIRGTRPTRQCAVPALSHPQGWEDLARCRIKP